MDKQVAGAMPRAGFGGYALLVIAACAAVFFLDGLIHTVMGPLAPYMAPDLHLGPQELGPVFSANLAGQTIGLLAFPFLTRRTGHRLVILLCAIGFALAQWATTLAWNAPSLFAFRLIDGVFLGGCMPSCLALVANIAPPARKGLAVTMLFTGYGLGATMSGIVAAGFEPHGGWRAAFAFIGCLSAATAAFSWWALRGRDAPADLAAVQPDTQHRLADILAPRLVAGTLLLWLLFVAMLTIQYCLSSWLPTLLVKVGRPADFAALSVTIFSLGGIIAALGVGLLIDRFGAARVLVSFLLVATALLFATGQVLASASQPVLLLLLVSAGFFFLGAYGGINVILATYYPRHLQAFGIGLAKSVGRIGTFIAPILIGLGLAAGVAETSLMSIFALPAALAAAAVAGLALTAPGRRGA
ncbi:MAG: MFS transporter [Croceibacterium sp.]